MKLTNIKKVCILLFLIFSTGCLTVLPGGLFLDKGHTKRGESCSNWIGPIPFIFALPLPTVTDNNEKGLFKIDNGFAAAKKNGGVKKISFYDISIFTVPLFFTSICTVVYGI